MSVDHIIVYLIGGGCAYYLVRKARHLMKGERGCSSCSGCPSAQKGCGGNRPPK